MVERVQLTRGRAMKVRTRIACLSAAVAAMMSGGLGGANSAEARDLIWDSNGVDAPLGQDGGGTWDETNSNWVEGDLTTGTNTTWSSANPDSGTFGNATSPTIVGVTNTVS